MRLGMASMIGIGTILTIAAVAAAAILNHSTAPKSDALMGDDFFKIRREALRLFPRGSRVDRAASELIAIGFRCRIVAHPMANINAESLVCDSHGRGYPTSPTLTLTVLARNGLLSDIEVWNFLQRADAETPEPVPSLPRDKVASSETASEIKK